MASTYRSISDEFADHDANGRRGSIFDSDSEDEEERNWKQFLYGMYSTVLSVQEVYKIFSLLNRRHIGINLRNPLHSKQLCHQPEPGGRGRRGPGENRRPNGRLRHHPHCQRRKLLTKFN